MQALWADGWFYISSAGLLVSGSLFFFLLSQYRAAADAVDVGDAAEPEVEAVAAPVRRVFIPEEPALAPKVASVPSEPALAPAPAPASTPSTSRENTTGGLSPAVVYLQNIQNNLNELHGEIRSLTKRVDEIGSRDEALIERLGELSSAVAELKAAAPAAVPAAAPVETPKRARKATAPAPEPAPEPATPPTVAVERTAAMVEELAGLVAPAPKPEPVVEAKPEPVVEAKPSPDATIRLESPPAEAPAAEEKPRRGPVWPV